MYVSSHDLCLMDPAACERISRAIEQRCHGRWQAALRHCVPQLIDLTFNTQNPVDAGFERQVRQVIHEHCCAEEGGDAIDADHEDATLENQVAIIVDVLETEHRAQAAEHQNPPPMMFG